MELDFGSKAGFQKFAAYILGLLATVVVGLGVSQAKVDIIVQIVTPLIPLIATIVFDVVNQIAAKGKAATEIKKMELAIEAQKQGVEVATAPNMPITESPEIKPSPTETPFDKGKFMDEVNKTTGARYSVVNSSTTFYNAEQVFKDWAFDNNKAWEDGRELLRRLCADAFNSIWGCSYEDAVKYLNDPLGRGCPTCTTNRECTYPDIAYKARQIGTGYYTSLLDYKRMFGIQ